METSSRSFYGFLLLFSIVAVHAALSSSTAVDFFLPLNSGCRGSVGDCLLAEDGAGSELFGSEFEMNSESNRRILAANRYISYGALSRNSVPCSRRGSSYYNCRPGGGSPPNPYQRGCNAITRCRS